MPISYQLKDIKRTSTGISEDHHEILNKKLIDLELSFLPIKSNHRAWQALFENYFPGIDVSERVTYFDAFLEQYEKIFRDGLHSKWMLKGRSDAVKNDRCIVFHAVSMHGHELQWANSRFFSDEDIVIVAVDQNCNALRFASLEMRDKEKVIIAACNRNRGWALKHASDRIKNNEEIVRDIVSDYGLALQHASERLRNDPYIAFVAILSNDYAGGYVGDEMKENCYYKEYRAIKDDDYSSARAKQRQFCLKFFSNKQKSARSIVKRETEEILCHEKPRV